MEKHPQFPGGTLLKLHGSLLSTSFHNEGIDNLWNGTGLRVLNGVVTELIGDTPYRSDM